MAVNQSNPNQKQIKVVKTLSDDKHIYAKMNIEALFQAMTTLSEKAFRMWVYLNKNQDKHSFWLSRVDALSWNIGSSSSYDRAIKELITAGYLVKGSGNTYTFYELPPELPENGKS